MLVLDVVKSLIRLNFKPIEEDVLEKASEFIITDLKYFRSSKINHEDDDNFLATTKGFSFFTWEIPTYKKLWYMITNRYPIISDICVRVVENELVVNVNGRRRTFKLKDKNVDYTPVKLEIDISSNIISYKVIKPIVR